MTTMTEIKQAVQSLSADDFEQFSSWFDAYEEERWDRQIERDQQSGPLRDLMNKARADFEAGKCSPL